MQHSTNADRPAPTGARPARRGRRSHHGGLGTLTLAALGVVYGDIGTSPLYTVRETFGHTGGLPVTEANVFGVLSLIFWSLMLVVTLKYVILVLRADNKGEGGVLALATLALAGGDGTARRRRTITALAIAGLALFYGDGLITPAISVLSAVEGLKVAAPGLDHWVVPIAAIVLLGLFLAQSRGTGKVGRVFGPVMCLWFLSLALLGGAEILAEPRVLGALDPRHALSFAAGQGWALVLVLGTVVLAVTGAEALYADMGHFGRRPIRVAWYGLVLPALVLNYFGQGALLLSNAAAAENPFFLLAPDWARLPLVVLSTGATIIASQAVISGVFSLTRQAVSLGFLPRMEVCHTSEMQIGQVYIPRVNYILLLGVMALVVGFGSSSALAAAYGISVTGAMAIDAVLAMFVAAGLWRWGPVRAGIVFGALLLVDLAFVAANALKIPQGGWFPLAVAAGVYLVVTTWRRGRRVVWRHLYQDALPVEQFLQRADRTPVRVAGTAVFMTGNLATVPHALLHNLKHNKVLHERVVLMTIAIQEVPFVAQDQRVSVEKLGKGFHAVTARYGFFESPDVPEALLACRAYGLAIDVPQSSFFLGRETLVPSDQPDLARWQEQLFITLSATAQPATRFFNLPPNRVVELGTQIEV
ncbi:potassium transporter Kup [Aerophototrophica crusticola]|uniref:Probable potassium transport system protein Kup n=1 Tax=Aerophototrophica crusticola TaxID=1709002 RepID=A0A858RAA7_9PROT|nr:potassium transporter Kup [Rhodospirillaceae bacterium B3]